MPPRTADAADTFRSVRREKLIHFLPWDFLFLRCQPIRTGWRAVISDLGSRRLIAASAGRSNIDTKTATRTNPRPARGGIDPRLGLRRRAADPDPAWKKFRIND